MINSVLPNKTISSLKGKFQILEKPNEREGQITQKLILLDRENPLRIKIINKNTKIILDSQITNP